MRLDVVARKLLPQKIRQVLGCWTLGVACRSMLLLNLYIRLMNGYWAHNIRLRKGYVEYSYQDRLVKAPSDGVGSFFEVFYESVYDSVFSPKRGDTVIDVGAYVGMWSVRAALEVGSSGKVVAIEPSEYNLGWLRGNVQGLPVDVVPAMASDRDGLGTLFVHKASACSSMVTGIGTPTEVQCYTLDTLVADMGINVQFIKIDAEGAEIEVLRGAEKILAKGTRLAIAAYHESCSGAPELPMLTQFLQERGYSVRTKKGLRGYLHAEKIMEGE